MVKPVDELLPMVCLQVELRAARWRGVCPPSVTVFTGTPPNYKIISMPNDSKIPFFPMRQLAERYAKKMEK
jgi:hypothetical protein